jgi:hypothetical protein
MNIYRGVVAIGNVRAYWSEKTRVPWMVRIMSSKRFTRINARWHISDRDEENKLKEASKPVHWLFKLQPLIDAVRSACHLHFHCGQYVTVDEQRVAFHGRHSAVTYNPRKPTKWGFTIHMAACAVSKYIHDFLLYGGKVGEETAVGLAKDIVVKLVWRLLQQGHIVVADNWFSSLPLVRSLWVAGTGYIGTLRRNVAGFPEEWCSARRKGVKKQTVKKGKWKSYQSKHVTMTAWGDRSTVLLVDTVEDPLAKATVKRWSDKAHARVPTNAPSVAKTYGAMMGGVDHAAHNMHAFQPGSESKRWWVVLAWAIINIAIHNAFIIYCHLPHATKMTNREFRLKLAEELVHAHLTRKHAEHSAAASTTKHQLILAKSQGDCVHCSSQAKGGERHQTKWICEPCGKHVCPKCCYVHSNEK